MPCDCPAIHIPVFGGQGQTLGRENVALDSPYAKLLLSICYNIFLEEIRSIDPYEQTKLDLKLEDFQNERCIVDPPSDSYFGNAVFSMANITLVQCLSYVSLHEGSNLNLPFLQPLSSNATNDVGVLGFSSGILAACAVAASSSLFDFLIRAKEVFRAAIHIGVHTQIYSFDIYNGQGSSVHSEGPWSVVIFGLSKGAVCQMIAAFNEDQQEHIYLTAVLGDDRFTISGFPRQLSVFVSSLPSDAHVHETSIYTLYHVPVHDLLLKTRILEVIRVRKIAFPAFEDLVLPIRSSFSGELVEQAAGCSLLEAILDMVLIQPVQWDVVVQNTVRALPHGLRVCLINFGPPSLVKVFQKTLSNGWLDIIDVSAAEKQTKRGSPNFEHEPIAIIGMAINVPGASDASQLWNLLVNGVNTAQEIPIDRFNLADYSGSNNGTRSMEAKMGNFINGADEFDHQFFNINPREATSMDPQQRILLHVAHDALDDAGYVPNTTPTFDPSTFGCFIGTVTHDYVQNLRGDIDTYYSSGTLNAFLSGRLSHYLGLSGPSVVVDTACSSSAVAIYQASRALMIGDCDAALAGGVSIITSPDMFIGLDKGHFLSRTGQCRPFDASADGYCRSEGCGIFVLKRLRNAISEGDRILGVIRGIEVNQSGNSTSIIRPHPPTQEALLRRVLAVAAVKPHEISLVEAHGTGTQAGDVGELRSVCAVLGANRSSSSPLHITSIKANIGHLEAASGCASLAKVLLMLREKVVPRQISLQQINPRISVLLSDSMTISTENIPWHPSGEGRPLLALINNFGASGSNATILVEEYRPLNSPSLYCTEPPLSYVFALSAKSFSALSELRSRYVEWLATSANEEISIADLSYSSTARRRLYPCRLALSVGSRNQLTANLTKARMVQTTDDPSHVVFVFTGHGTYYAGMGRALHKTSPIFRRHVEECRRILVTYGFPGALDTIINDIDETSPTLDDESAQIATFVLEYALSKLWMDLGLRPVAVVGHSLGEYAALVTAGVLTVIGAIKIVATRARLMKERCAKSETGMLAVSIQAGRLQAMVDSDQRFCLLSISCFNSPQDCVVSGPLSQLKVLKEKLCASNECRCTQLAVPFGYHSSAMDPILPDLAHISGATVLRPPTLPVISTTLGRLVAPGDRSSITAAYFVRHCVEPVRFEEAISSFLASGICPTAATWLEIGPHPAVTPLLKSFPALSRVTMLCTLRKQKEAWLSFSEALAVLYLGNFRIDWRAVFAQTGSPVCIPLPPYPFERRTFWVPFREVVQPETTTLISTSGLLQPLTVKQRTSAQSGRLSTFTIVLDRLRPYVKGHQVAGFALCPASLYLECASAGVISSLTRFSLYPRAFHIALRRIEFKRPFLWDGCAENGFTAATTINIDECSFSIASGVGTQTIHAHGDYIVQSSLGTTTDFAELKSSLDLRIEYISTQNVRQACDIFSQKTLYEDIFPRIVQYSHDFRIIQSLILHSNGQVQEVVADICPRSTTRESFVIDPVLLDAQLHVAGFVANLQCDPEAAFICQSIGSFDSLPFLINNDVSYIVYSKVNWLPGHTAVQADCYLLSDTTPRVLVSCMTNIRFRLARLSSLRTSFITCLSAQSAGTDASLYDAFRGEFFGTTPDIDILHGSRRTASSELSDTIGDSDSDFLDPNASLSIIRRALTTIMNIEEGELGDDVDLSRLGLDSLAAIEALHLLRTQCNVYLPASIFETHQTLQKIRSYISTLPDTSKSSQDRFRQGREFFPLPSSLDEHLNAQDQPHCLRLIHSCDNNKARLVLVHDGSGLIASYQRLLPFERSVWGISNPFFFEPGSWESVIQMATRYANHILDALSGPVVLGGWSFGGVVAFEIAKQLLNRQFPVKGVVLIDSPSLDEHSPLPPSLLDNVVPQHISTDNHVAEYVKSQFLSSGRLLSQYKPLMGAAEETPQVVYLRCTESLTPPTSDVSIPTWLSNCADPTAPSRGWNVIVGHPITVLGISAHHFNLFDKEKVAAVSLKLAHACELLDNTEM